MEQIIQELTDSQTVLQQLSIRPTKDNMAALLYVHRALDHAVEYIRTGGGEDHGNVRDVDHGGADTAAEGPET